MSFQVNEVRSRAGQFKKGVSGNPTGRPTGRKNKRSIHRDIKVVGANGVDPMEFLLSVAGDDGEDMRYRLDAARTLMPFMYRKKPMELEVGDKACDDDWFVAIHLKLNAETKRNKGMPLDLAETKALCREINTPPRLGYLFRYRAEEKVSGQHGEVMAAEETT